MTGAAEKASPTCFMAMPITTRAAEADMYGDVDHWTHVRDSLFKKAITAAGFTPIVPVAQGSHLIHGLIIKHLTEADLVLCDLSGHNPNVFFELGVRTSLNLPIALVRDERTDLPFDTSGINTHSYDSRLKGWEIEAQQDQLRQHIQDSVTSCAGQNPLWRQFGLTIRAQEPEANESPLAARVDLLSDRLAEVTKRLEETRLDRPLGKAWYRDGVVTGGVVNDSPVERFQTAVVDLLRLYGVQFVVIPEGSVHATVAFYGNVESQVLVHVRQLADVYGVVVNFERHGTVDPNLPLTRESADYVEATRLAEARDKGRGTTPRRSK